MRIGRLQRQRQRQRQRRRLRLRLRLGCRESLKQSILLFSLCSSLLDRSDLFAFFCCCLVVLSNASLCAWTLCSPRHRSSSLFLFLFLSPSLCLSRFFFSFVFVWIVFPNFDRFRVSSFSQSGRLLLSTSAAALSCFCFCFCLFFPLSLSLFWLFQAVFLSFQFGCSYFLFPRASQTIPLPGLGVRQRVLSQAHLDQTHENSPTKAKSTAERWK